MAFSIYAQADVVTARLTVEPSSAAGALETTIMESIAAGADTQRAICDILGLAPSLVLQVLGDLWRAGRITVDLGAEHESLELTSMGSSALRAAEDVDGMARTTASTATTADLVVERLTGRALPVTAALSRVPYEDRDLIVPALPDDREASSVTSSELVAALAETMKRTGGADDQRGDQRVTAAFLQPDLLRVAARRKYVELRAAAQVTATGDVTLAVLDDRLTIAERDSASLRLQKILEEQPTSLFANRVRTRASHIPLKPYGVDEAIEELDRAVVQVESNAAIPRQQSHDRAATATAAIVAYAQSRAMREMEVRLVQSSEEHTATILDMFNSAEHQIVLAAPWVRQKGLEVFRTPICDALDRGVQVVLLWGIDGHKEGLGPGEEDWLDSITAYINNRGAPGKLLYNRRRAARSHAKLVIADDRRMLVTSKNFLSRSNHFEVGVVLSTIGNRSSPTIDEALRYVYDKAPDPRMAYGLHRLPGAFGERDQPDMVKLTLPRLTKSLLDEDASEASIQAWCRAWRDTASQALSLLSGSHPVVDTISDLQHRGVLRSAVSKSASRVLLTSDKVTDTALTEDIADQIGRRLQDGTAVLVRYREAAGAENRGLAKLLGYSLETSLSLERELLMHAKLVLHDDTVLVGSFNPLSVDADLRHSRAVGEFGVQIYSSAVANAVWTLLGGTPDALSETTTRANISREFTNSAVAQELLEALESPAADRLTATVGAHGLARILSVFNEFDLDDEDLIRVGGAALAVASSHEDRAAAAEVLLEPVLGVGYWGVARAVRSLLPDSLDPRPAFLDALEEGGRTAESLLTASTSQDAPTTAEAEALTVVDSVALLLQDDPYQEGNPAVTIGIAQTSERSAAFVDAAIEHSRQYGPLPATPPGAFARADGDLPTLWTDALATVAAFKEYDSQSTVGEAFRAVLFAEAGELSQLEHSLATRNQSELLAWQAAASKATDSKWLDKSTQRAGLGRIVDSRRRAFLNLRRRLREAAAALSAAIQLQVGQPIVVQPSTGQLELINGVIREAEVLLRGVATPVSAAETIICRELQRLLDWNAGNPLEKPVRSWRDWPFVYTYHAITDNASTIAAALSQLGADLAVVPDPESAVRELAGVGEFDRANELIELLPFDDSEATQLRHYVVRCRSAAQALIDEQLRSLAQASERAGLLLASSLAAVKVTGRQSQAAKQLEALTVELETRIADRRVIIANLYEQHRAGMSAEWSEYVQGLIAENELELAEKAVHQVDGTRHTPSPRPFLTWTWRDASLNHVASWLSNGDAGPFGVDEFIPAAEDRAGQAVLRALVALAEQRPGAAAQWVAAVQHLVHSDNDYPTARPEVVDGITTTTFQLPYDHQRLPRLRWVGKDPTRVAIGDDPAADCSIRFYPGMSSNNSPDVAVDVADVLSLLARPGSRGTPSSADRALRFTAMVCSRLSLGEVIDPRDTPTGTTVHSRHRLSWLLAVLGLNAEGRDIDRLISWSGGHSGVMWSLIKAAREDPIEGVSSLVDRPDLAELLLEGVELDLNRDEDLWILALGQTSLLFVEGCNEADVAASIEDEWRRAKRPIDLQIRVPEVLARLENRGYLTVDAAGVLTSCACRAVLAVEKFATADWFRRQMDLLDPVTRMRDHQYEFVLEMVRHQIQADRILDNEEVHRRTSNLLLTRLGDTAPFDLVQLTDDVLRNYRLPAVDLIAQLNPNPLEISDVGPSLWVECLVSELLNNAVSATADLTDGEGTIWVTVVQDPKDNRFVILEVRNNGRRVPPEVREAFHAGQRLRRPQSGSGGFGRKQDRGLGLYMFRTYGALHGVHFNISEDTLGCTTITCRFPRGVRTPTPSAHGWRSE